MTTMNFRWAQTNAVLDGFFELLACGKCKKRAERPIKFAMCGHMFCDTCCPKNTSICVKCNMHVGPNETQPYHLVAQLISYCQNIKEAIAEIDGGNKRNDKATRETQLDDIKVARAIGSTINRDEEMDSETPGYRDPTQNSLCPEEVDWETPGYRDPTQMSSGSLRDNDAGSGNLGYRVPTQTSGSFEFSGANSETPGFRDPTQIARRRKEADSTEKMCKKLAPNPRPLKNRAMNVVRAEEDGRVDSEILAPESVGTEDISMPADDAGNTVIPASVETADTVSLKSLGQISQRRKSFSNENFEMIAAQANKVPINDSEATSSRGLKRGYDDRNLEHSEFHDTVAGNSTKNVHEFAMETEQSNIAEVSKIMKKRNSVPAKAADEKIIVTETLEMAHTDRAIVKKSQPKSTKNLERKNVSKKVTKKIAEIKRRPRNAADISAVPKIMPKNVNKRNPKGESMLHTACVKGQGDYVQALLEAGANPNTKDNAGWTPLQEAVTLGHQEICKMLLESGASANTPGMENRTALHDATINDRLELASLLLRFNANRDVYDKFGKRPIEYVVSDEMRALLLADRNNIENLAVREGPCINTTLDHSVLTPNAKVVVLPSNLSNENKKLLMQIASRIKVAVATSFRPGITHVVVETNERNITKLNYIVMLAILEGKWILNGQWIAISTDLNDISEIDLEIFQVHGAPNPGTPERSRLNEEKQHPRLFDNCFFYFTIGARSTWSYGKLELTKENLTNLVIAGQGEILNREPDPEDVKDYRLTPFHVAHKPMHPLHRCSHYIIYMPGKDEPRVKYNMPHIKSLPLVWFFECIEKFALVDPILMGIS